MRKALAYFTLLAIGYYGIKLYLFEQLVLYIHEKYILFFLFGALICFFVGVLGLLVELIFAVKNFIIQKKKEQMDAQQHHIFSVSSLFFSLPLIIFLLVGLLIQPKPLSYKLVAQRSIDPIQRQNIPVAAPKTEKRILPTATIDYDFNDWIHALILEPDMSSHVGKQVKLEGFIFKMDEFPERTYYFYRYMMYHCAVDARPYGYRVIINSEQIFKQDEWVEISGTFGLTQDALSKGTDVLILNAEKVLIKPQPQNPYLYPAIY